MLPILLALAQTAAAPTAPAPSEIVAAAPAGEWTAIAADDLLVMDLAPDVSGKARRVVIQLIPAPFARRWVSNIRALASAHWWDGTSVNRVQDNYVVQWGDATERKPLPPGLNVVSESGYEVPFRPGLLPRSWPDGWAKAPTLADPYAERYAFAGGMPFAVSRGAAGQARAWPVHCYGTVGVGRNLSPDTGSGAELYVVIGHAPRHLDRNIAVVGRVVEGIEHLSSLPRGTAALGFYDRTEERVPIVRVRLASDLPMAERPRFEHLSTSSDSFAHYADSRANRRDPFFIKPAGGADVCNVPVPVRPVR